MDENPYQAPQEATGSQLSILKSLGIIVAFAVVVPVLVYVPGLAVLLVVLSVPPLVRTCVRVHRAPTTASLLQPGDRSIFALAGVALFVAAVIAAGVAGYSVCSAATSFREARGIYDELPFYPFLAGAIVGILTLIWTIIWLWPKCMPGGLREKSDAASRPPDS